MSVISVQNIVIHAFMREVYIHNTLARFRAAEILPLAKALYYHYIIIILSLIIVYNIITDYVIHYNIMPWVKREFVQHEI